MTTRVCSRTSISPKRANSFKFSTFNGIRCFRAVAATARPLNQLTFGTETTLFGQVQALFHPEATRKIYPSELLRLALKHNGLYNRLTLWRAQSYDGRRVLSTAGKKKAFETASQLWSLLTGNCCRHLELVICSPLTSLVSRVRAASKSQTRVDTSTACIQPIGPSSPCRIPS